MRPSSRTFRTGSRGSATPGSWAPSSTCSWTGRARTRRSRGRAARPARRPRSTASSISATAPPSRRGTSRARASPRWKATSSSASGCSRPVSTTTRVALVIATVGGAGWAPVAPGTVASALTALLLWLVPFSRAGLVLFFVAVTLIGTWAAEHAERALGGKDPGAIVIDEVAGMTLSVLALPLTLPVLAVAFALFRVFDIVKPFPAGKAQALRGGAGVMVDDLIAGLYALAVVVVLRALVGWP
ncbi:MAG: hypothetical protein DMD80_22865 [Candidatus Rokuibacteriota bacterium]|nr:MAG: hypothetical protein DMD80_22865 [Candidatus Rokubacteria bacterium]